MKIQLNCKAVIFVTDKQGQKKYYASHFYNIGVCDSKSYNSLPELLADLNTLYPASNLWTGLSGFQPGAPNIPADEVIIAQIAFKGCYDNGIGTANDSLVVVKQQTQPNTELFILGTVTPSVFMQNLAT